MPLSLAAAADKVAKIPRALSLAATAVAAATTSLLLISVAIYRAHHVASSSTSPPAAPSTSASTTAALPPAPGPSPIRDHHPPPPPPVPPCPPNSTHLVPCHEDTPSGERHCPPPPPPHQTDDPPPHPPHPPPPPPHCRVPAPAGYRPPPTWPARRERARYANVELPFLPKAKVTAGQGKWVLFPNGDGVGNYVEHLERVLPLRGGVVRTALDIGCGMASFGDYLLNYGILTMSISPRNRHGAQVQLALERGLPAMIGALGAHRLPYPSRSFDMVHCADCLEPQTAHDGLYMLEIDRLLRPGGYWVYSRPPISWKSPYNVSNEIVRDMHSKQLAMDDMAYKLHWTKLVEDTTAVWRKHTNHLHCDHKENLFTSPPLCTGDDPDSAWYTNTSMCVTCLSGVELVNNCASCLMEKWPKRLGAVPPRIASGEVKWLSIQTYKKDSLIWEKRVNLYMKSLTISCDGTYRNVMDMNAGFGGFAAAMSSYPVWVMNVVPANVTNSTLGIIYERGLVGTYMDWCEAFSTYPRTYDLIHADGIFSLYMHKCGIIDILVEMDRILRPQGAVIVRDRADIVLKVKKDADRLGWHSQTADTENGSLDPEKLLIASKSFPL